MNDNEITNRLIVQILEQKLNEKPDIDFHKLLYQTGVMRNIWTNNQCAMAEDESRTTSEELFQRMRK